MTDTGKTIEDDQANKTVVHLVREEYGIGRAEEGPQRRFVLAFGPVSLHPDAVHLAHVVGADLVAESAGPAVDHDRDLVLEQPERGGDRHGRV